MTRRLVAAFFLALWPAAAQALSVCEALSELTELNGRKVKIRGLWEIGDTGQTLWSVSSCEVPTIRDGWVWRDIIRVAPEHGSASIAQFVAKRYEMFKAHRDAWILSTLSGRLETRDHFEVWTLPS